MSISPPPGGGTEITGTSDVPGLDAALAAKLQSPIAQSDVTGLVAALAAKQASSAKGQANGYAALDSGILVPIAQIPTGTTGTTVALGNHSHAAARPGELLGVAVGTGTTNSTSTGSTVVDPPGCSVTITIPASGIIDVKWSALWTYASGFTFFWALREGSTILAQITMQSGGSGGPMWPGVILRVAGLTPGAKTVKWSHFNDGGGSQTINYTNGIPPVMYIYAG